MSFLGGLVASVLQKLLLWSGKVVLAFISYRKKISDKKRGIDGQVKRVNDIVKEIKDAQARGEEMTDEQRKKLRESAESLIGGMY